MISVPRFVVVGIGALFSVYILVIASASFDSNLDHVRYVIAMALYAIATVASLWPSERKRMSRTLALFNVAVCIALPILVTSQLAPEFVPGSTYSTWYVAGVGVLMVITSARRRHLLAWIGVGTLVVQTTLWLGPGALAPLGVVGSALWVAVSHALSRSLDRAGRDARAYAHAEREAAEWQAAQEAHLFERQFRLGQTSRMALPMLAQIAAAGGELTEEQRKECIYLEGGIRDEIRGRDLLSDPVREQVMIARRRGAIVYLLDEGGIDELPEEERARVHDRLALAIRDSDADTIIARTVPEGSDVAVTVVGLRSNNESEARALGHDSAEDDEVDLWLEIPRVDTATH